MENPAVFVVGGLHQTTRTAGLIPARHFPSNRPLLKQGDAPPL